MKIITPGKVNKPSAKSVYKTKCKHCGCVFEYLFEESRSYPGYKEKALRIVECPQEGCDKIVITLPGQ